MLYLYKYVCTHTYMHINRLIYILTYHCFNSIFIDSVDWFKILRVKGQVN